MIFRPTFLIQIVVGFTLMFLPYAINTPNNKPTTVPNIDNINVEITAREAEISRLEARIRALEQRI